MARKKKQNNSLQTVTEKGLLCAIAGLVLLLLPILHGALRPLGWPLLIVGAGMMFLPVLIKALGDAGEQQDQAQHAPQPFATDSLPAWSRPRRRGSNAKAAPRIEPVAYARSERWEAKVFADIEWRRFEAVCEALFTQAGFTSKSQSHGADGGVDIWLYSKNTEGPAAIAQCKHWRRPVGVKELREFYGVMASHNLKRGTFATSSVFTAEALKFAKENGINPMDGTRLLAQIGQRDEAQQMALLDVAYEGEYWRPTCASCGVKMVERAGRSPFWGCVRFPACTNKIYKAAA